MGNLPFVFVMTLLAAAPLPGRISEPIPEAIPEARIQELLLEGTLSELREACLDAEAFGLSERRQQLRDRLLTITLVPTSLEEVLNISEALLLCRSPDSAFRVLGRYSPGPGEERRRWLLMRWQTADAGLDHTGAALALRRLVGGDLTALEQEQLVEARGTTDEPAEAVVTVNALDQLAHHEIAAGDSLAAVEVLLAGRATGAVAARRLGRAAELLAETDVERSDQLLELALDQAAADQAWGLAVDLLRQQLRLQLAAGGDGERPRDRLERLTSRLDDRYSAWQLQEGADPDPSLRSPRDAGGHAAVEDLREESTR